MKIKYFSDTDTALVEFSNKSAAETKEINENIYIDVDRFGNLISMTIEHARKQASLPFISFEQLDEMSEARQILSTLLDEAKREGAIRIRRRDGQVFVLKSERDLRSPLDVNGPNLNISRDEIVEFVREGRRKA